MLYFAAILFAGLGLAHSWLGERYLLTRLFKRGDLPKLMGSSEFTRNTLRFTWHLTTVLALGIALVLLQLASGLGTALIVTTLGWTAVVSALLPLYFTRGRHLSWLVLLAAGGACLWWASI